ncbi:macrophage mannose receptor 1-like isoform X3 [Brienomyrus brachyistius]|uniref:macrophage mannose receptor 1-like isoform X3 n=1 Tax=Brienomyrus brachyistius TaxID=42636 RepID=UPI0020B20832|nr:macrophage mannose receptor 1-like isoform X3 [Brienomyrus brachyistius]
MNWSDAQSYCRQSYTDLATVRNQEDNDLIHKIIPSRTQAWIGMFQDTWGWSDLSNSSFRNWKNGQNYYVNNACALAQVTWPGTWDVTPCDEKHPFICYDENLILVNSNMTWNKALNYCRTHHSDLVSVHNEEIQYWVSRLAEDASTDHVWLGLRFSCYLNFWFWVSAENFSYQNWAPNNISKSNLCGTTGAVQSKDPHYWVSLPETKELNFICSKYPSKTDSRTQYLQNKYMYNYRVTSESRFVFSLLCLCISLPLPSHNKLIFPISKFSKCDCILFVNDVAYRVISK